jgi:hypothetical protein
MVSFRATAWDIKTASSEAHFILFLFIEPSVLRITAVDELIADRNLNEINLI